MKRFAAALLLIVFFSSFDREMEHVAYRQRQFNIQNYVGIHGFDPVSYFRGKPVKGVEKLSYNYDGIFYWFATPENRDAFRLNPSAYEPQYGGWNANEMSNGNKEDIDPAIFKIINNKLYMFNSTMAMHSFSKNLEVLKTYADQSWVKFQ